MTPFESPRLRVALAVVPGAAERWEAVTPESRDSWARWVDGALRGSEQQKRAEDVVDALVAGSLSAKAPRRGGGVLSVLLDCWP